MSIQSITGPRGETPLALAKDRGATRTARATNAPTSGGGTDRAIVSPEARDLSATLAGAMELPKLHLSPTELRELIMPAKRPATVYDARVQDPGTE
jgi:hypothetical protein